MSSGAQRQFGNYVASSLIGRGGMGEVRLGQHRFLGTRVAIKTLRSTHATDSAIAQRFFQEARAAVEIDHPGVVKVLDFGQTEDGTLYLVMEFLVGVNLGQELAVGLFEPAVAARLGTEVARAVQAAHARGIIHRDLKPENLFLTVEGRLKVLDFGIAKLVNSSLTGDSTVLGTPLYVAPEQIRGAAHATPASDIYSLGAILYQFVVGRPPFLGADPSQVMAGHLFGEVPRARDANPALPEALDELIVACLAKEPAERPASMAALELALAPLCAGVEIPAPRAQVFKPEDVFAETVAAAPGSVTPGQSPLVLSAWKPAGTPSPTVGSTTQAGAGEAVQRDVRRRGVAAAFGGFFGIAFGIAAVIGGWIVLSRMGGRSAVEAVVPSAVVSPKPPVSPAVVSPVQPAAAGESPAKPEPVVLRSDPPGATVKIDGVAAGTTPVIVDRPLPFEVELTLSGYRPVKEVLSETGDFTATLERLSSPRRRPGARSVEPSPIPPPGSKPSVEGLD